MRLLLCAVLALGALPAVAQTDDTPRTIQREIVIDRDGSDSDGPTIRRMVIVNGDTTISESQGDMEFFSEDGANVFLESKDGDGAIRFRIERDGPGVAIWHGDGEGADNVVRLNMPDIDGLRGLGLGAGPASARRGLLREFMGRPGVSDATRQRMRTLEMESQSLARRARVAEGGARRDLVSELDGVLAELFDIRGQARREEAAHLREQADEMRSQADEMDAAARDRQNRRQAIIDARRAELLGDRASDW